MVALAPSSTQNTTRYAYDVAGNLSSITDALGYPYAYQYNARGEPIRWSVTSRRATYETFSYDVDGNLNGDVVYDDSTTRNAIFSYLPGGKLSVAKNNSGVRDTTWAMYSGLGPLTDGGLVEQGGANAAWASETRHFVADALGNAFHAEYKSTYSQYNDPLTNSTSVEERGYERGTGRLAWDEPNILPSPDRRDTTSYDLSGNVNFETSEPAYVKGSSFFRDRASYYGTDGTLRASDSRSYSYATGAFNAAFEEYRYDALGRRVLVEARRYCDHVGNMKDCSLGWVRRTVWDGAQELYEIQMPADTATENDVTPLSLAVVFNSYDGTQTDPNPYYGRVAYTHGLGIDRPQSIIRMSYVSRLDSTFRIATSSPVNFAPFAITPFWDVRGQPETGIYPDLGMRARCQGVYCVKLFWPGKYLAYERPNLRLYYWQGSLYQDKQDASGNYYRRNRYYDSKTGLFTQEDPTGLAGGMNLYGFAAGDPINFSDPFGLWPCPELCGGAGTLAIAGPGALAALGLSEEVVPVIGQVVGTATLAAAAAWGISSSISAMRNAELGDKARALLKPAREHMGRMTGLGPDDEDPNGKNRDWAGDARKSINNARKVVEKMKGKSQEALTKEINDLSEQVSQLAKRVF